MPIPFLIPALGYGAAALGVGAAGTAITGAIPGLKDELGLGEKARAKEEINQGRERGYDYRTGEINRGIVERAVDGLLGNDPTKITELTQTRYKDNLDTDFGDRITKVNKILSELNQPGSSIALTETSDPKKIERELQALEGKLPGLQTALSLKPDSGLTVDSSAPEIARVTRGGLRDETNAATTSSPEWQRQEQRYIDALDRGNKQFAATMALNTGQMALSNKRADNQMEIAQMQQQLQMRRQDSADRRADRRDRQAMIQQLMGGLSALGTSIAI